MSKLIFFNVILDKVKSFSNSKYDSLPSQPCNHNNKLSHPTTPEYSATPLSDNLVAQSVGRLQKTWQCGSASGGRKQHLERSQRDTPHCPWNFWALIQCLTIKRVAEICHRLFLFRLSIAGDLFSSNSIVKKRMKLKTYFYIKFDFRLSRIHSTKSRSNLQATVTFMW
jgi:hypothetical protein